MTFEEALAYMQDLRRFGIKLGNERFETLMTRLGNPHRHYGIAHVAGTKGKGSTTAMIASCLHALGFRVGGYYSPYVYDIRERVQVDGEMIPRERFANLVTEIAPHVEAMKETALGQTTEFELKTAVGFRYFAECAVNFAAVEVGIGGRLDATNVVTPTACVITNIGLDHTHILGDTHAKIAVEKAGIIKPGVPIVTAADEPDALTVISRTAREHSAPLVRVLPGAPDQSPAANEIHWFTIGDTFTIRTVQREYSGLSLRMGGAWQRINAACAIGALEAMARRHDFELSPNAIREGLSRAYLPGRLEIVSRRPLVVMDGAHNAMAANALAVELARFTYRRLLLVIGMIAGHGPEEVLAALAPMASKVYATQTTWTKGQPASAIAEAARAHCRDVQIITPPLAAAQAALATADADDLVLITGSFYVVGDVQPEQLLARRSGD